MTLCILNYTVVYIYIVDYSIAKQVITFELIIHILKKTLEQPEDALFDNTLLKNNVIIVPTSLRIKCLKTM